MDLSFLQDLGTKLIEQPKFEKIIGKKLQFGTILLAYKKWVDEEKVCKQRMQPYKFLSSNSLVVNTFC